MIEEQKHITKLRQCSRFQGFTTDSLLTFFLMSLVPMACHMSADSISRRALFRAKERDDRG